MDNLFFNRARRNNKRYRQILSILSKYGFSVIAEKVAEGIPFNRIRSRFLDDLSRGARIKLAIEELGPTFIKLGQIMSTRYDLIPEDISLELESLQDDVYEVDIEDIKRIFIDEIGESIEDVFESFDEKPLAAASIGQVHRAILKTGESVVVKIQRPDIKKTIEQDIEILKKMATLIDDNIKSLGNMRATAIIEEFSKSLTKELDYVHEAHSAQKIKINSKKDKHIIIPKIYWEITTRKVITMEHIVGIKVNNKKYIESKGWNREAIAEIIAQSFLEQVFLHGLFHGDPHPGNILIMNKDTVSFIDFGIVGYIDNQMLDFIITTLRAISEKNIDKIIEKLSDIDSLTIETDEAALRSDIFSMINYYFDLPVDKIDFAEGLKEFLAVLYKHKLKVPSQLTTLVKAMVTLEGTLKNLNPKFNLMKMSSKIMDKLKKKKIESINFKDAMNNTLNIYDTWKKIPKQMTSILNKVEKNQIKVAMEVEGLDNLEREINTLTNKISLSLLVASLIVGSSIVIHSGMRPIVLGVPLFGLVGYVSGIIMGFAFIISAVRSRKRY